MQAVTVHLDGSRLIHTYEELMPEKRPQDPRRDGSSLSFATLEHHGFDVCPEALRVADAEGRHCIYVCEDQYNDARDRPQDDDGRGTSLRFQTRAYGGDYPDDMPQEILVSDRRDRCSVYSPVRERGHVVDSKGFELVRDAVPAAAREPSDRLPQS
jgi:hypothetical protein